MVKASILAAGAAAATACLLGIAAYLRQEGERKERAKRAPKRVRDWRQSPYGKLLFSCDQITGRAEFRQQLNIPYEVFLVILTSYSEVLPPRPDARGVYAIDNDIKVVMALKRLTSQLSYKDIGYLCNLSEESARKSFLSFIDFCSNQLYKEHVVWPTALNGLLDRTLREYNAAGLPGCMGSMDSTHWEWGMCPAGNVSIFKGKEGYACIRYNVTVNHSRRVLHVSQGYPGTYNDKTIVKYDDLYHALRYDGLHEAIAYRLYDESGASYINRGLYLIVDGGYVDCRCLQRPCPASLDPAELAWSDHLESIRKDVECFFGILKQRFRIISQSCLLRNMEHMLQTFKACCAIHNMILDFDGNADAAAIVATYECRRSDGLDYPFQHEEDRRGGRGAVLAVNQSDSESLRKQLVENFRVRMTLASIVNRQNALVL